MANRRSVLTVKDDDVDILDLFRGLVAEWRLVTLTTSAFIALAIAYILLTPPLYQASAVVIDITEDQSGSGQLLSRLGNFAGLAGVDVGPLARTSQLQARETLHSRRLVEAFVQRNDVFSTLQSQNDDLRSVEEAIEFVANDVRKVTYDPRRGINTVSVSWNNPEIASEWANDYVEVANDILRNEARESAQRSIDYLNSQIVSTSVVGIQQALFNLLEHETKTLMLANARDHYAFYPVDPARPPLEQSWPRPLLLIALSILAGMIVATSGVIYKRYILPAF